MLLSYSISSGALESPDLLSYPMIVSDIAQHHHTNNNPNLNLSFIFLQGG